MLSIIRFFYYCLRAQIIFLSDWWFLKWDVVEIDCWSSYTFTVTINVFTFFFSFQFSLNVSFLTSSWTSSEEIYIFL